MPCTLVRLLLKSSLQLRPLRSPDQRGYFFGKRSRWLGVLVLVDARIFFLRV